MKAFFGFLFGLIRKIILIGIFILIIIFAYNNHQVTTLSLKPFAFEVETRLFIIVLFCFFTGMFIGMFSYSIKLTKEKFKNFGSAIKIKYLQSKIKQPEK